ncbi:hypothetical protein COV20_00980 [Candidatus Woesearchaeota archaeon CG10_big_fil_rev_8_21_14_0_10_45_16]|nr:MAG: hypothetical protein COV20_00980 [Candidatus Woesearchaeota archaeon CG10_big_fil_rev_8_21_14_0_10_45_16]
MTKMINREDMIGDIVEQHPELIETLLSFGVHCVGCHVSPYESLEDGFRGHGFTEEEIDEAVKKLNEQCAPSQSGNPELTITPAAADKIKLFCASHGKKALRLSVHAGGCSGLKYGFELADEQTADDIVIEKEDAKVFLSKNAAEKLNGAVIDYSDGLTDAGFKITNPNAKATCGCGSSFR